MAKKSTTQGKTSDKDSFTIQPKSLITGIVLGALTLFLLMAAGARLMELNLFGLRIDFPSLSRDQKSLSAIPSATLISMSFMAGDWNPRLIDLRTSSTVGISVDSEDHSLSLFDLWANVPNEAAGYDIYADAFDSNGKKIAHTAGQKAIPGIMHLDAWEIDNFSHPSVENAWLVQSDWKGVDVYVYLLDGANTISKSSVKVTFNTDGTSWMIAPPNASFVLVAYQVNDGPELIMDLSSIMQNGIDAREGDQLTITHAWYKSNLSDTAKNIRLEGYLSSGNFDANSLQTSPYMAIREGVNPVSDLGNLAWTVPADKVKLVMTLVRNDRTILDRYTIPLASEDASALVPLEEAVRWRFAQVKYYDFEQDDALMAWQPGENNVLKIDSSQAFTGSNALSVETKNSSTQVFANSTEPFRANLIVGQVFWPKKDNIGVNWAQVCIGGTGECVSISQEPNQWNLFTIDLRQMKDKNGISYSELELPSLYIQGQILGVSPEEPYVFYLDGIQIYQVATP